VAVYMCPSSRLDPFKNDANNNDGALIHAYIGISGATPDPAGRLEGYLCTSASPPGYGNMVLGNTGMLTVNRPIKLSECLDGTSNVIVVGEQSGLVGTNDLRNRYVGGWAGAAMDGGYFTTDPTYRGPL